MKLKMACKFVMDLNSNSDEYIEFKLLLEEDINKLDLEGYKEDLGTPNCKVDESFFSHSCIKIFNRFHRVDYSGAKALYSRVVGFEIECEDNDIKCLLNILYSYDFDNFLDIEKRLRDRFNFRESFMSNKKRHKRNKFGKKDVSKNEKKEKNKDVYTGYNESKTNQK